MQVQQTLHGANPQTAVPAPEEVSGLELPGDPRKCVVTNFPTHKLFQPCDRTTSRTPDAGYTGCYQECVVVAFDECLGLNWTIEKPVVLWRTWRPSPKTRFSRDPQIAFVVLVQGRYGPAEIPVSVALHLGDSDGTEPAGLLNGHPNGPVPILQERSDGVPGNFWISGELAVLPTGKPFHRTNPKSTVARNQQGSDVIAGELLTVCRLPRDGLDTIEAEQSEFRAQPQITIRRLRHRKDGALGETFANFPRGVRVLADIE